MEVFSMTVRVTKTKALFAVQMLGTPRLEKDKPLREWATCYQGDGFDAGKFRVVREVLERRTEYTETDVFKMRTAGGDITLEHEDGMRVAMAAMLAGRCASYAKGKAVADGLVGMPSEAVLYWFTLCEYGQRRLAGRKALFTLLAG